MRRNPLLEALAAELDQAAVALQSARRIAAELQRSSELAGLGMAPAPPGGEAPGHSLRYSGMTVAEAAAELEIGEEQVRRLLRSGALLGVPYGGRVGWRLSRAYVADVAARWQLQREGRDSARVGSREATRRTSRRD